MARIVVLGPAGCGKTTFARALSERTGAAFLCLDEALPPRGVPSPREVEKLRDWIRQTHAGEAWVSDGNFAGATFDLRLPRADLVIWLNQSRPVRLWRVLARPFRRGEPHRLTGLPAALRFAWSFDRVNRPRIEAERIRHGPYVPVLHLRGDAEIAAYLAGQ